MPVIKICPSGVTSLDTAGQLRSTRVHQLTDGEQVGHGLVDGAPKDTGVEVSARSVDSDLVVVDTTQTVGQARSLGVQPVVVCSSVIAHMQTWL